jgi:enamine deaminase RidA (YjgF/YER057c/UK114 family)
VLGFVYAVPGFTQHPTVIDGCSRLLVEVFGKKRGMHTRSAIGVASLPFGIPVEVECVARLKER